MSDYTKIAKNYDAIRQNIQKWQKESLLCQKVALIAVSKGQPKEAIEPLLYNGHLVYGENRVQEAQEKWPSLKLRYPELKLHLIGSLQTNKVKEALMLFDAIHTIDRETLVDAIVKEKYKGSAVNCQQFFIQVNTGDEPQKGGISLAGVAAFLNYCRGQGLNISGLMCVPPAGELPAPHFALLYKMARELRLTELSMGMSGDYPCPHRHGTLWRAPLKFSFR
jgi:uncharacterized pyridoxal phosphate-containing UPF0001 family protein